MKATTKKMILIAALALSASTPALAQQPEWSQPGDYYSPSYTYQQQPTPRQQYFFQQGDYYAPGPTVQQQPTPRQQYLFRHGDYYAPGRY
jgi:hypothetical protein